MIRGYLFYDWIPLRLTLGGLHPLIQLWSPKTAVGSSAGLATVENLGELNPVSTYSFPPFTLEIYAIFPFFLCKEIETIAKRIMFINRRPSSPSRAIIPK